MLSIIKIMIIYKWWLYYIGWIFLICKDFAIPLDPGGDKNKLPHIVMYVWKIGIHAPDKYSVIIVRSPIKVNIIVNLADEAIQVRYITIPKICSADDFRVALLTSFIPSALSC